MKKFWLVSTLGVILYAGDISIEELRQSMNKNLDSFKNSQKVNRQHMQDAMSQNYKRYQDVFQKTREYYQKGISAKWGKKDVKLSSKSSFTQYNTKLNSRETIDFENGEVILEVLDDKFLNNAKEFQKKLDILTSQTVNDSIYKDPINKKALDKLKKDYQLKDTSSKNTNKMINKNLLQTTKIKKDDVKTKIVKTDTGKKKISYVVIKMVPEHLQVQAKIFKNTVDQNSKRFDIPTSLIFAVIQTESSFNPIARSYVPAFGLMQIVPATAGKDSYKALYRKNRLLSDKYLYNPENNIELGTKYIQIIQNNYLKGIKDSEKLFFCTATAYNAGIGSLCKSLVPNKRLTKSNFPSIRAEAIKKINNMTTEQLYTHLTTSDRLRLEAKKYVAKIKTNTQNYTSWDR